MDEQTNIIEDKEVPDVVLTTLNDTDLLHANKSMTCYTFTKTYGQDKQERHAT